MQTVSMYFSATFKQREIMKGKMSINRKITKRKLGIDPKQPLQQYRNNSAFLVPYFSYAFVGISNCLSADNILSAYQV